jgi:hypothetical protein
VPLPWAAVWCWPRRPMPCPARRRALETALSGGADGCYNFLYILKTYSGRTLYWKVT